MYEYLDHTHSLATTHPLSHTVHSKHQHSTFITKKQHIYAYLDHTHTRNHTHSHTHNIFKTQTQCIQFITQTQHTYAYLDHTHTLAITQYIQNTDTIHSTHKQSSYEYLNLLRIEIVSLWPSCVCVRVRVCMRSLSEKKAINYRALFQKMTSKDNTSSVSLRHPVFDSWPYSDRLSLLQSTPHCYPTITLRHTLSNSHA